MSDFNTIEEAAQALNDGKITIAEFQKVTYMQQKNFFLQDLLDARAAGDWKRFISRALSVYEVMPEAFSFYDEIPDGLKYDFAISAYIHHGDSIPAVRKAVKGAAKYGKADLPADLRDQETITIYRAGEEDIRKCKYRISWTTDLEVAKFFFYDYIGRHAAHLYKGQIKTSDIIAYNDERKEKEVMQYRKVFAIEEITDQEGV